MVASVHQIHPPDSSLYQKSPLKFYCGIQTVNFMRFLSTKNRIRVYPVIDLKRPYFLV
jgi:hypothetical protein